MMSTIAKRHGKPVVVFTETYKFSDKVHLDPINNNEIGDPAALLSYSSIRAQKNVIINNLNPYHIERLTKGLEDN